MPTLFLICGLPGAGKTTLARRLGAEHRALRLTPDAWMARIVGDGWDEARRGKVEAVMAEIAERVLALGVDVVLDFGFWSRAEREEMRTRARAVGAAVDTRFLDPPLKTLQDRLDARNADLRATPSRSRPNRWPDGMAPSNARRPTRGTARLEHGDLPAAQSQPSRRGVVDRAPSPRYPAPP